MIATRGRSSLARALLGSNTAEVIRRSHLPVLAVKAKGEGLSLLRSLLGRNEVPEPEPGPGLLMQILAPLALPCLLALLVAGCARWLRARPVPAATLLAALCLAGCAGALAFAIGGSVDTVRWTWVPQLDVAFALHLDSFRSLFLALIFGTAAGVLLFAASAYRNDPRLPCLLATLLLFTAAMVGIVLADDFFLLFMAWEATSLLSFLLIGWDHHKESVRWKSTQALLVTALGGLALLAGLILLRITAGTGSLSALAELDLSDHALAPAIILLVGLGALTKSAQFPFHFWLPGSSGAMISRILPSTRCATPAICRCRWRELSCRTPTRDTACRSVVCSPPRAVSFRTRSVSTLPAG